jgi:hypothetical protein
MSYLTKIQSINVIQSPFLRRIFLLLRQELKESDIPGRTTLTKHVKKAFNGQLKQLEEEMMVCDQFILMINY